MENLTFRQATANDLMLYFNWANDPLVRNNAIHTDAISIEDHTKWFQAKIKSDKSRLYVFEFEGQPIGQVRFDIEEQKAVIDYSVAKEGRGKGFGKKILTLAFEALRNETEVVEFVGQVKNENSPSLKIFERLGFEKVSVENGMTTYSQSTKRPVVVIANSNPIHKSIENNCVSKYRAQVINDKEELTLDRLNKLNPDFIFFPHWSSIIPNSIFEKFNCIVFHMTDLPYGRGGSPLQNLIVRGHQETKLSALKVAAGIDTGDIFLKRDLSLEGTATAIFKRAGKVMEDMIETIVTTNPKPMPQEGEVVTFKRRKPEDGNIDQLESLENIHDYIRMLDAEGYPNAFLETDKIRIEFSNSSINEDEITANVRIIKK